MIKNYLKIAFRNIRKQKLYALINIMGLALGIACCIIIYLFIQDEYSFDKFHESADAIYRVEEIRYTEPKSAIEPTPFFDTRSPEGIRKSPWLPLPLGPTLSDRLPEIEEFVRTDSQSLLVRNGDKSFEQEILFAEPSFFEVFSFPLIRGTASSVLDDPSNVVLTPETARKYFGDEDPVGKSLVITIQDEEKVFTVSGVVAPPPANSSFQFSFIAHIKSRPHYDFHIEKWNSFNTPLFVKLAPGADINQFEAKLNTFAAERYGDSWMEQRDRLGLPKDAPVMEFTVVPLKDIHLDAAVAWTKVSNPLYSYILGAIAILILVIACINYITLALARSSGRAKEVGVRKASGARRGQIALQFWGETQLLTLLALIAGIVVAELALPFFNQMADKSLTLHYIDNAGLLTTLAAITLITGLIAGSYPAFVLSRYQPVKVLKGINNFSFKPRLTKGLLVVQYSLSILLIISSLIMYKQLHFVSSKELGYNTEQVVMVPTHTGWNEKGTALMERYRTELQGVPGVESVSGMAPAFTKGSNIYGFDVDGERKTSFIYYVDDQLIPTLGISMMSGRNFSDERSTDTKDGVVVNEALVKTMGWDDPIGQTLTWRSEENPSTVIGVMKDFHFLSLENEIQPMLFHMDPEQGGVAAIAVKIKQGMIGQTLPKLEEKWTNVASFKPFDFWFLDDAVAQQYEQYERWLSIMGISTAMAILIACLGLFGLAGLTAVNKTKEIGIRKVMGATAAHIVGLLSKDFLKLVTIGFVIAAPIAWYLMSQWLADFAYRIDMGLGIFLLAGAIALLIAWLTVGWQSFRAALANPVDSLRSE